jgi:hypothetical protein
MYFSHPGLEGHIVPSMHSAGGQKLQIHRVYNQTKVHGTVATASGDVHQYQTDLLMGTSHDGA